MKAAPFDFVRATALSDVFAAFERHGDDARIVAGGQSLMPMMNMRLAAPRVLVDINHIAELNGVSETDGTLRIGALTRHQELGVNALVAEHAPLLTMASTH
ncbi:MAG TPA: xanthine dehydrogenase family protein subunit M, partial [Rhodospirillales bacterium]|nr:xanthine dehydrogenase family protein subunit M [Rhodospirillales bacterium]